MTRVALYYVLGAAEDTRPPWVLTFEPQSLRKCRDAIRWQHSPPGTWVVCRYDPVKRVFLDIETGEHLRPGRGPYTAEAWGRFIASLPTPPDEAP